MRQRKIVVLAAISAVSLLPMLALAQDQDSPEKSSAKQASSDAGAKSSEREASDVPSIDPFEISDRIELSDEQQEQLAAVKERYQPRIDRAREQYRQRIDRVLADEPFVNGLLAVPQAVAGVGGRVPVGHAEQSRPAEVVDRLPRDFAPDPVPL